MGAASHTVTLRFEDGEERSLAVAPDQTILAAALAEDVPLMHQCQSGTCGSCIARLRHGDAEMRTGSASVLLKSEQAAGQRLLCLTEPRGDCTIALDYSAAMAGNAPIGANAFVNRIERIADDAMMLELELADGDWIDFRPGQFVEMTVPGTDAKRRYSMASAPGELPKLEFLIRLLPGGTMSDYLTNRAQVDDVIALTGAYGQFFLRDTGKAPMVMIAGGTGLAPMMAMLDTLRARPGIKGPMLLSFGCTDANGLFHREALDLRALWMPTLEVRTSAERGKPGEGVLTGNPVAAIAAHDVGPDTHAYLCGPPPMIAAAQAHLEALGVPGEQIHSEQFVASE